MIYLYSQVHGIVWDTIQFVEGIITTEMNSTTDNPVSNCYNNSMMYDIYNMRL